MVTHEDAVGSELIDRREFRPRDSSVWPVHVVRAKAIAAAVAELQLGSAGDDGRREVLVVHPASQEPGIGLAPGIAVTFGVVNPGEHTLPRRSNASSFTMALAGTGAVEVGDWNTSVQRWDSWNTPSMSVEQLINRDGEPFVYVSYSNAALLQKLEVLVEEHDEVLSGEHVASVSNFRTSAARAREIAGGPQPVGNDGALLLPYEHLIDPDFVESRPLMWPWADVSRHLGVVRRFSEGYTGRPLWCLYNPATGTRNGTTASFFATIAAAAPNFKTSAHRHVSAAINFIMDGDGWSVVDGTRVEWAAGDIMLSAPGWAPHSHGVGPDGAIILTVQDHPLHIGMESLIWQEELNGGSILTLGAQAGFQTNVADFERGQRGAL